MLDNIVELVGGGSVIRGTPSSFPFILHTAFVITDFVSWWQKLKIDQTQRCTNTQTKGTVQHCYSTMIYTGQHYNTEHHGLQQPRPRADAI